jgi:hypothetical protein
MKLKPFSLLPLLLAGILPATASTHVSVGVRIGVPPPVIVRQAPPHRVSEAMVVAPGPGFVWVAGHYSWNAGQWVWVPGAWVTPPQPGAVWVEGRWDQPTQAWTEGHWEVTQPAVVAAPPPPSGTIVITSAPPPIRIEHRGHRPGHGYVWVTGYWGHDHHGHYVWVPGHWILPPRGHHRWIEPRWEHRGGSYLFIEGHWD